MSTLHFQPGHIGLNVTNLNRSKAFYQQVFKFQIIKESQQAGREFALLGVDGQALVTLWQQSNGTFTKTLPGLHHLAFMVESMHDVEHVEANLRGMGVRFLYDGIVPHSEGAASGGIFFEDPDGIRLEIFARQGAHEHKMQSDGPSCGLF